MPSTQDELFRALADSTRRALFERLCQEGAQTVGELTAQSGVSQPAISKHLALLKHAGLVRGQAEGRHTRYTAQVRALAPLIGWAHEMTRFWNGRFDDLEDLLKRMDQ
jgi:DNA-binding transcriptional ArsR family regulator